jgi:hypothetical protein
MHFDGALNMLINGDGHGFMHFDGVINMLINGDGHGFCISMVQ